MQPISKLRWIFAVAALAVLGACSNGCDPVIDDAGTAVSDAGAADGGVEGAVDGGAIIAAAPSHTDENCIDGRYREAFSNQAADVSGLLANYTAGATPGDAATALIVDILQSRYPAGAHLVQQGYAEGAFDNCSLLFIDDLNSASEIVGGISGAVHECGHAVNLSQSVSAFVFTESVQFACEGGAFYDDPAPPLRSTLADDAYNALWPTCRPGEFQNCDIYQEVYFDEQAFESLLEELLQYTNDIAASYAVADLDGAYLGIERTGAITMLWWLQRYLKIMRVDYAPVYNSLMSDPCWQDMVLSVWGRGWTFLDATAADATADEVTILGLIEDPELLNEIQRVRNLSGCAE